MMGRSNSVESVLRATQASARQGKSGRENAVYTPVHEAFETAIDADLCRISRSQRAYINAALGHPVLRGINTSLYKKAAQITGRPISRRCVRRRYCVSGRVETSMSFRTPRQYRHASDSLSGWRPPCCPGERAFATMSSVMRGNTRRSIPHMRILHGCHAGIARELHPISVRTDVVRRNATTSSSRRRESPNIWLVMFENGRFRYPRDVFSRKVDTDVR